MSNPLTSCVASMIASLRDRIRRWTRPLTRPILGYVLERFRSPGDLVRENALLRKQLAVACRRITRPRFTRADRGMLVLLARLDPTWHNATALVQPATITLIEQMARNNRLLGAERIRGELLKFHIRVAKRTIQRYMRRVRQPRSPGQRWATFPRNHAHETWARDFLQTCDLVFRPIFAFFVIALGSRRVVHVGVTRSPSSAWVAQLLREATPWGEGARFLRSVRTECLDHVLVVREGHLRPRLRDYCAVFNDPRPHQGIGQKVPGRRPRARLPTGSSWRFPFSAVCPTSIGARRSADEASSQHGRV